MSYIETGRRIVRLVPLIAALCVGVVIAPPTRAAIIQYDFSSNATMTVDSNVISISGSFDFDITTSAFSIPDVTLKLGSTTETFTQFNSGTNCSNTTTSICLRNGSDFLGILFSQSLALDAVDPLALGPGSFLNSFSGTFPGGGVNPTASAITGNVAPAAVPEPASIAILGAGLAAFGLIRPRRRKCVPAPGNLAYDFERIVW
jgi:hypothetical protein